MNREADAFPSIENAASESARWVENQEAHARDKEERERTKKEVRSQKKRIVLWSLILVCMVVVFSRAGTLASLTESPKELRVGSYQTDPVADDCIHNLWIISSRLQAGVTDPAHELVCPATNAPYRIEMVDGAPVVRCPNPEAHKCASLLVSQKQIIPEVSK